MDSIHSIREDVAGLYVPLLRDDAENSCEAVQVFDESFVDSAKARACVYDELCECIEFLKNSRKNLECYQAYVQKNHNIRNFWSKTSCVSALAVLALSTLGGSLVYIAMTKEIDAAMVTLGPAFTWGVTK